MNIKQILPLALICFIGCSSPTSTETLTTIDIEMAHNRHRAILLSDFSNNDIEYIPLETHPDGLFTFGTMFASDKFLIVYAFPRLLLFDRQTGKFIRQIAAQGGDINNFTGFNHTYPFDENSLTVFLMHLEGGIEYDIKGNVLRKICFLEKGSMLNFFPISENIFGGYKSNITGNELYKLFIFDYDGNELNRFINHHSYEMPHNQPTVSGGGFLAYKWQSNVYFYENCVDTIYKIDKNNLIPYYHIKLGKYNPPYSEKPLFTFPPDPVRPLFKNYIFFNSMYETDRFLFFSFRHDKKDRMRQRGHSIPISMYFGFYNKQTGITKISAEDHTDKNYVINDVDHFVPIYPFYFSINQSDELVAYIEAESILDWFEANPDKAKTLPEHIQALSKLKLDDNPVVVITKLKQL